MNIKTAQKSVINLYEDLRDAVAVVEAMKVQKGRPMKRWSDLKKKFKKNV